MASGLRVLITNIAMNSPSGTVQYTLDLALELQRQGHQPVVHTWLPGTISDKLLAAGIEVYTDLRHCRPPPDIIHGHHYRLVRGALRQFPKVPAVYICHDHTAASDRTLLHPRIRRHIGVSRLCLDRLLQGGAPLETALLRYNFVDTMRFTPRSQLPQQPQKALVFSNYARLNTQVPAVTQACRRLGLTLDLIGSGMGRGVIHPETLLGGYDLVFAKAKAAIEAMAVGAAVVLCDFGGVGPMVGSGNFDQLRPLNFGFQALTEPLCAEAIERQILRYDAEDAQRVQDRIRREASLTQAVRDWIDLYRQVMGENEPPPPFRIRQPLIRRSHTWFYALRCRMERLFLQLRITHSNPNSKLGKSLYHLGRYIYRLLRLRYRP